jgi:hypothetical protein
VLHVLLQWRDSRPSLITLSCDGYLVELDIRTFGFSWVLSGTVADLVFSWWNGLGRHSSDIWNLVPLCLMWIVWKERNRRTFEDLSSSDSQFLDCFPITLFDWSRAWGFTTSSNVVDFYFFFVFST